TAAGLHVVNLEVALTSGDKAAAEREVTRVLHRDERSAVALQEHLTEGGADAATTHEEPSVVNRTGGGVVADRTQSRERHSVDVTRVRGDHVLLRAIRTMNLADAEDLGRRLR